MRVYLQNRPAANALAWLLLEMGHEQHYAPGVALNRMPGEGLAGAHFEFTRTSSPVQSY